MKKLITMITVLSLVLAFAVTSTAVVVEATKTSTQCATDEASYTTSVGGSLGMYCTTTWTTPYTDGTSAEIYVNNVRKCSAYNGATNSGSYTIPGTAVIYCWVYVNDRSGATATARATFTPDD